MIKIIIVEYFCLWKAIPSFFNLQIINFYGQHFHDVRLVIWFNQVYIQYNNIQYDFLSVVVTVWYIESPSIWLNGTIMTSIYLIQPLMIWLPQRYCNGVISWESQPANNIFDRHFLNILGSNNSVSPVRCQSITWNCANVLSTEL